MALTQKQLAFSREFQVDFNSTQAAIRAGYSKKTAASIGSENLKKPEIIARINAAVNERAERTKITADMVVEELAAIAFCRMTDFASWSTGGVRLKNSSELTEVQAKCVSELYENTTKDGGSIRFKLHNKLDALEKLAKHLNLYAAAEGNQDADWNPPQTVYVTMPPGVMPPDIERLNGVH